MNIHTLDSIGQCQPEGTKIKWLELTLQVHPKLTSSIFLWKTANPDIKTRQLSSLIAYLFEQYGNLKPEPDPRGGHALSGQRQKNPRKRDRGLNRDHRAEENRERGRPPRRQKRRRSCTLTPPGGGRTAASAEITSRDSVSQVGSTTGNHCVLHPPYITVQSQSGLTLDRLFAIYVSRLSCSLLCCWRSHHFV